MSPLKRLLRLCLRHGVPLVTLLGLAWLLYTLLGPQPRWSKEGSWQLNRLSQNGQWLFVTANTPNLQIELPRGTATCTVMDTASGGSLFEAPLSNWWHRPPPTISTEERYVVVYIGGGSLRFFDLATQRTHDAEMPMLEDGFDLVAFHALERYCVLDYQISKVPKGKRYSWDGRATVLDAATGKVLLASEEPRRFFHATPQEELIFNCAGKHDRGLLEIWKWHPSPQVRRFPGLTANELSRDGRTLVVLNEWGEFSFLDITSGEIRPISYILLGKPHWLNEKAPWPLRPSAGVNWKDVGFSPDGKHWGKDYPRRWEVTTGTEAEAFGKVFGEIDAFDYSPCGRYLFTQTILDKEQQEHRLQNTIWDLQSEKEIFTTVRSANHSFTQSQLVLRNPGNWNSEFFDLATGASQGSGKLFNAAPEHLPSTSTLPDWLTSLANKFNIPAATHWRVTNPASGRVVLDFSTTHDLSNVAVSPDERLAVTVETVKGTSDQILKLWDVPARRPWAWILGVPAGLGLLLMVFRWWRRARAQAIPLAPVLGGEGQG